MTTAPEPKRRGRPVVPDDQRRDRLVQIRTTAARKARLTALAEAEGLSVAAWVERQIDAEQNSPTASPLQPDA